MTEIGLSCSHRINFRIAPPVKGDYILCGKCDDYRQVVDAPEINNKYRRTKKRKRKKPVVVVMVDMEYPKVIPRL